MALESACFISYRHRKVTAVIDLVRAIHDELQEQLSILINERPFWDESLDYGEKYNDSLAAVLSSSACMLVVYTPVYALSEYCRGEFMSMQKLEECRVSRLGEQAEKGVGMIIPIVLKKHPKDHAHPDPWLPNELEGAYHYFDLSPYILLGANRMRAHKRFREEISKIADYIVRVKNMIELDPDHCVHCKTSILRGAPEWAAHAVQKFPLR